MNRSRLSRNSRKLGRKNYIKANVKQIREIQTKVRQPDEESLQKKESHAHQLKRGKSTTKKSIEKSIGHGNKRAATNEQSTRSQLTLSRDDAVSLCMKKFIENIKISQNKCDVLLKNKSSNNIIPNRSESSSTNYSSSSQENTQPIFAKKTSNVVSNQVSTKSRLPIKSKISKNVLPNEFEIVKTIFRQPNHSRAYKNEGCQTIEESNESISSSILFRYPSNGKSTIVHETSEQSSQTDVRPIRPKIDFNSRSKMSTIPSGNSALKFDRRSEAMKKFQQNRNLRFQKNPNLNKQLNNNINNAIQIEGQKITDTKNNIIANSNQATNRLNAAVSNTVKVC